MYTAAFDIGIAQETGLLCFKCVVPAVDRVSLLKNTSSFVLSELRGRRAVMDATSKSALVASHDRCEQSLFTDVFCFELLACCVETASKFLLIFHQRPHNLHRNRSMSCGDVVM